VAKFPTDMRGRIERSKTERSRNDREWSAAIRMLRGEQWLYWSRRAAGYNTLNREPGEVRVTVNQMLNIERNIISRLTLNPPSPVVLPASDTIDDITKATASEMALRYFWLSDRQSRKWQRVTRWLAQTGNAALHTYYEPSHSVDKSAESMPDNDELEGPKPEKTVGNKKVTGRIKCDVISPFNVFFEPGVNDPDEARWVAIRTYATKSELKDLYPSESSKIEDMGFVSDKERQPYEDYKPDGRIECFEIYWRDGRHAMLCGDTYLATEISEDVRNSFPVRLVRYHVIEGDLWGQGPMVQIADLQQLYNRTRTQIHANVRLMGNPPWLIPRTADVRKGTMMNRPGAVIRYTPGGGPPAPASPQQLPSHVLREPGLLREEMSDVAGAHGITLGRREAGVKSGVHARTLTQQDSAQLLTTQHELISAVEDVMLTVLILMKRHYNERRVVRMLDSAGVPTWRALASTDIVDDPEIHVDGNTLFKVDAATRESRVMELVQLGLMSPEEAKDAISFRTFSKHMTAKFVAISHARDMLQAAIDGQVIEILPTDDLDAFTKVWSEYVQTAEYYDLPPVTQDYIAQTIKDFMFAGQPEEAWQKATDTKTISPHQAPKQTAPQLMPQAQPAPPTAADPLAGVPFPTEGQNIAGMPSAISSIQGGG
jgi:hypothetical protein